MITSHSTTTETANLLTILRAYFFTHKALVIEIIDSSLSRSFRIRLRTSLFVFQKSASRIVSIDDNFRLVAFLKVLIDITLVLRKVCIRLLILDLFVMIFFLTIDSCFQSCQRVTILTVTLIFVILGSDIADCFASVSVQRLRTNS